MSLNDNCTRLLLVDDDPQVLRLIDHILRKASGDQIHIESLDNATEALARLSRGGIDILLTDLEMPGPRGIDLLRHAKQINPCCQVILLTGNSTSQSLLDALELGATDYLLKPVDQAELIALVEQAQLRGNRWRRALAGTWRSSKRPDLIGVP